MGETTISKMDLDKLRVALATCEEALVPASDACTQLRAQFQSGLQLQRRAVPPLQGKGGFEVTKEGSSG